MFQNATVEGTTLVITFDETLAAASSLANSAFTVKKTPADGTEQTVSLVGSPSISGATVTLTLAAAIAETDAGVKVSYTKPTTGSANKLADANGNEVDSFTDQEVTNALPTVESAAVQWTVLIITFDRLLGAAANLANSAFTVKKTPANGTELTVSLVGSPSISGAKVFLTLAAAVAETDAGVKVSYTKPTTGSANKLQDADGNEVDSFTDQRVSVPYTTELVSNTYQPDGQSSKFTFDHGQQFTTGGNSGGYSLQTVTLDINQMHIRDLPEFAVEIWTSSANNRPVSRVGTVTAPASDRRGILHFTASGTGLDLDASTKYFVVVDVTNDTSVDVTRLQKTPSNDEDAGAATGWSIGDGSLYRYQTFNTRWRASSLVSRK